MNSVNNYLQNSTYTYDANGNITQIVDASGTHGEKTANYTYDDLNRLIEAAITNVPTGQTAYDQTYAYSAIGNITNKSDIGDYTYTGSSGVNYANPHAATTINGAANTYDKDGNLLSDGILVNTWDYRDQLAQSVASGATSTYSYDHMGQQIKQSIVATTTIMTYYPNKFYNIAGSTSTKNIFLLDGTLIATVTGVGTSTAISYIHADHLGSMSVATDQDGIIKEFTDYYPYGSSRLDEKSGPFPSQRKYIGQEFDGSTGLSYLNARYYDGRKGQFVSQDPVFLGEPKKQNLKNPQSLNSYSYSENNPITKSDPSGKCVEDACVVEGMVITSPMWMPVVAAGVATIASTISYYVYNNNPQLRYTGQRKIPDLSKYTDISGNDGGPLKSNNNAPKWQKNLMKIAAGTTIGTSIYKAFLGEDPDEDHSNLDARGLSSNENIQSNGSYIQSSQNYISSPKQNTQQTQSNRSSLQSIINTISSIVSRINQIIKSSNNN